MADKKQPLSTADILRAARSADADEAIVDERQAAKERLEQGVSYTGPRYLGKTIEEWMDHADAGLANIHDIRKALYCATPEAKNSVPALVRWLSHRNKHFRFAAARTLGLIGPDASSAIDELICLLDDADALVRAEVLESLTIIGVRQADIPRISRCLTDKDNIVQRAAIAALKHFGK